MKFKKLLFIKLIGMSAMTSVLLFSPQTINKIFAEERHTKQTDSKNNTANSKNSNSKNKKETAKDYKYKNISNGELVSIPISFNESLIEGKFSENVKNPLKKLIYFDMLMNKILKVKLKGEDALSKGVYDPFSILLTNRLDSTQVLVRIDKKAFLNLFPGKEKTLKIIKDFSSSKSEIEKAKDRLLKFFERAKYNVSKTRKLCETEKKSIVLPSFLDEENEEENQNLKDIYKSLFVPISKTFLPKLYRYTSKIKNKNSLYKSTLKNIYKAKAIDYKNTENNIEDLKKRLEKLDGNKKISISVDSKNFNRKHIFVKQNDRRYFLADTYLLYPGVYKSNNYDENELEVSELDLIKSFILSLNLTKSNLKILEEDFSNINKNGIDGDKIKSFIKKYNKQNYNPTIKKQLNSFYKFLAKKTKGEKNMLNLLIRTYSKDLETFLKRIIEPEKNTENEIKK